MVKKKPEPKEHIVNISVVPSIVNQWCQKHYMQHHVIDVKIETAMADTIMTLILVSDNSDDPQDRESV